MHSRSGVDSKGYGAHDRENVRTRRKLPADEVRALTGVELFDAYHDAFNEFPPLFQLDVPDVEETVRAVLNLDVYSTRETIENKLRRLSRKGGSESGTPEPNRYPSPIYR